MASALDIIYKLCKLLPEEKKVKSTKKKGNKK